MMRLRKDKLLNEALFSFSLAFEYLREIVRKEDTILVWSKYYVALLQSLYASLIIDSLVCLIAGTVLYDISKDNQGILFFSCFGLTLFLTYYYSHQLKVDKESYLEELELLRALDKKEKFKRIWKYNLPLTILLFIQFLPFFILSLYFGGFLFSK